MLKGFGNPHAEIDLIHHLLEFGSQRGLEFISRQLHTTGKGMTRLQGATDQIQGFGQLALEFFDTHLLFSE